MPSSAGTPRFSATRRNNFELVETLKLRTNFRRDAAEPIADHGQSKQDRTAAPSSPLLRYPSGNADDEMDLLAFDEHIEDPEAYEIAIADLIARAKVDPDAEALLIQIRMHPDREAVFQRFYECGTHRELIRLLRYFRIDEQARICDVGCGPGYTAWSLHRDGFRSVAAMDPNASYITGTGYLAQATPEIEIIGSMDEWARGKRNLDAVVSKATVHHWQHIPQGAIQIRRNLKPGGLWFCVNEFVANTPRQIVANLHNHLLWSRLRTYEWPYPAAAYADLITSGGFELCAVVPQFYRGNGLAGTSPRLPNNLDIARLDETVDGFLTDNAKETVEAFWSGIDHFRRHRTGSRLYSRPQAFVFRRVQAY